MTRLFGYTMTVLVLLSGTCCFSQVSAQDKPENVAVTSVSSMDEPGWRSFWKPRFEEKLAQAKAGNIDIIYLGDSIIHGWEGAGKAVFDKYYSDRNVLNLGFSGDRTEHVLWRLNNGSVDGISPKLVILMIGTNNVGHNSSTPAQTIEGVAEILRVLGVKLPDTKVLLLAVFPRGADENDGLRQKVNQINEGLPALADNSRVFYLNINDKFLDADGKTLSREIMPDLLHPNARGYEIWAQQVEPYIQKFVYPRSTTPRDKMSIDWWKNRHEQKKALAAKGDINLVLVGDSITHGWEGSGAKVYEEMYTPRKALNLGYGGDQTQDVLWRLDNGEADGYTPKAAMLMIGTNNMGGFSSQEIIEGNKAIVQKMIQKWPSVKVILLSVFPRGDNNTDPLRLKVAEVNKGLEKYASTLDNVTYFSFNDKLLAPNGDMTPDLMPDKVHLTPAGYRIWADSCEPLVKQFLGE